MTFTKNRYFETVCFSISIAQNYTKVVAYCKNESAPHFVYFIMRYSNMVLMDESTHIC